MRKLFVLLIIMAQAALLSAQTTITVQADKPGIAISPQLWGIFFEDINWAADGGLYAEMVQNRSFEYANVFGSNFTPTTAWSIVQRGGASATLVVTTQSPLNAVNTHYVTLSVTAVGNGAAGLCNSGYAGIAVKSGETYNFSFFARRTSASAASFTITLESTGGTVYSTATMPSVVGPWTKYSAAITSNATDTNARLVIVTNTIGNTDLDMISLFPQNTFKNRDNGLRADLVQRLIDLKPGFIRFPGGCVVHSNNLATSYRWKTTIGPVEGRKNNANRWGYMQTCGLGFYEYFQLCEDIGAKPLPVLPVGVSCHFKTPYEVTPIDSMQPWINDALDLIEYANGASTTTWGALRAAAGHPAPFNLEYIGVGNEEWGQEFKDRSNLFISAIRAKYPSLKIVGTAGPSPSGSDYTDLWAYNDSQKTYVVDEHYYMDTTWFIHNSHRYDGFDRSGPKVFAGEYASRSPMQKTLANAIAEAAFMTGLERNGDVVALSCYAPLFRHVNCNGSPAEGPWDPCLIYFDNAKSFCTPSYYVQALFANNTGHCLLPATVQPAAPDGPLFCVSSKDTVTGDIIIKVINTSKNAITATVQVSGVTSLQPGGTLTVVTTDSVTQVNSFTQPTKIAPVTTALTNVAPTLQRRFPAYSASVLRYATRAVSLRHGQPSVSSAQSDSPFKGFGMQSNSRNVVHVNWSQDKAGLVSIKLYTSSGKLVAPIVTNSRYGSGMHRITWSSPATRALHGLYLLVGTVDNRGGAAVVRLAE
jgi:alpha-L-arabinofuranosidase